MPKNKIKDSKKKKYSNLEGPPGRIKIANALRELLKEKDFNSITTYEISSKSGMNEALIYRYFGDKRGLLQQVLKEYMEEFIEQVESDLNGTSGAINKLERLIKASIKFYDKDRVFSKILLLEARNYPDYFKSETYSKIKEYANIFLKTINEGIKAGDIREGLSPAYIRQILLGAIEHMVLPAVIFNRPINVNKYYNTINSLIFKGIIKSKE